MTEPTRRLPDPTVAADGKLVAKTSLTPTAMTTRGAVAIPSAKVIPIIFIPGIMGTNLRATTQPDQAQNASLKPGQPAWRPPNGMVEGLKEASAWSKRNPRVRQQILDGDTLEVDNTGLIDLTGDMDGATEEQMRTRWWGEIYWQSYGPFLCKLHHNLNSTFENSLVLRKRQPNDHWESIMEYDRTKWNATDMPALTENELEKFAQYQYPVYACGYNWTQSNELSAIRVKNRALEIIDFWQKRKFDCKQVILVTHSMGGLVGRACAKLIPDQVAGVVHGVMPALGAPLAYRRLACGAERSSPSATSFKARTAVEKFAEIAGETPEKATPAMATSSGPLELLPNHLYPKSWLVASIRLSDGKIKDLLPVDWYKNVYDLYRDFSSWFCPIDLEVADPAEKYSEEKDGVKNAVKRAVKEAERFHTVVLGDYYHPNTYAYYGADQAYLSFGTFRWITNNDDVLKLSAPSLLAICKYLGTNFNGGRTIEMPKQFESGGKAFFFMPSEQDTPGDGTVSHQSGDGPRGKIKRIFRTTGYDHQGSYDDKHMVNLTFHCIVKVAQEAK